MVPTAPLPPVAEHNSLSNNAPPLEEQGVSSLILPSLLTGQARQPVMNTITSNTTVLMLGNQPATQENPTTAAGNTAPICPVEARLLQQFVSGNTGRPLPAQSGSSVEKFLSKLEGEADLPDPKVKGVKNEAFVSSTSLGYPVVTPELANTNVGLNPHTLATPVQDIIPQEKLTSTESMQVTLKEDMDFVTLPETLVHNSQTMVAPGMLDMLTPDSTVKTSLPVLLSGQPVLSLVDSTPLLVQESSAAPPSAPILVDPIHLVDDASIMNKVNSILPTENNLPMVLLDESLTSNHFKAAGTSLQTENLPQGAVDILPNGINQQGNLLGHELESEAHLMNTQLDQLLTTDLMPEGAATLGGPLVRDVLLGSGAPAPAVLHHTSTLGVLGEVENKKAETLLPQELTHIHVMKRMSEEESSGNWNKHQSWQTARYVFSVNKVDL
ncbi:hypothetical protein B566_EDAN001680 [Ephemera danica]|nr:hypothetical protein B566_EDAN001680 [Ephemera danica]